MEQYSNLSIIMESETILKNGASSKSHTSRRNFLTKMCVVLPAIFFSFISVSCSKDGNSNNPFMGTWEQTSTKTTLVIKKNTWTASHKGSFYNSGTYTFEDNKAIFVVTNEGVGLAKVGDKITVLLLNSGSDYLNETLSVFGFSNYDVILNGGYTRK